MRGSSRAVVRGAPSGVASAASPPYTSADRTACAQHSPEIHQSTHICARAVLLRARSDSGVRSHEIGHEPSIRGQVPLRDQRRQVVDVDPRPQGGTLRRIQSASVIPTCTPWIILTNDSCIYEDMGLQRTSLYPRHYLWAFVVQDSSLTRHGVPRQPAVHSPWCAANEMITPQRDHWQPFARVQRKARILEESAGYGLDAHQKPGLHTQVPSTHAPTPLQLLKQNGLPAFSQSIPGPGRQHARRRLR